MQGIINGRSGYRAALGSAAALWLVGSWAAAPVLAAPQISGNIGVVSDYVLRGITTPGTESDGVAGQGGLDLTYESGLYAGWWASSLGYGTADLSTTVENDLYAGWAGTTGAFSYDVGAIYYWYMDDGESSGWEAAGALSYGPITLGANYLLSDVSWGNRGDIYWTLGTDFTLPLEFGGSVVAGYYTYQDSGRYIAATTESSAFRHVDLTLSRQIGDTPGTMFATYVLGGKDRDAVSQTDKIVLGFTYEF